MLHKKIFWLLGFAIENIKLYIFPNKPNIYRLLIKVNNSCNYKCTTCGNWKNKKNTFLSKDAQNKIVAKFKNKLLFLSITGGEPFLEQRKLFSFIYKIKESNPKLRYISINTNCSLPFSIYKASKKLLQNYPDLNLRLGLHYIPSKSWGIEETGVISARINYRKTEKILKILAKKFKGRFSFYKMITLNKRKNIDFIEKEKDLWLNFAVINSFYNNLENKNLQNLTKKERIETIDYFLKKNKKINFLSKNYLLKLKEAIRNKRTIACYAGINRVYINEEGEEFICSMGLKERKQMTPENCKNCWTACEAVFDLPPSLFLSLYFNLKQKEYPWN